jgi:hypothetical protein
MSVKERWRTKSTASFGHGSVTRKQCALAKTNEPFYRAVTKGSGAFEVHSSATSEKETLCV